VVVQLCAVSVCALVIHPHSPGCEPEAEGSDRGASSAQVLGASVLSVPSVAAAMSYIGDSDITLVLTDTAPNAGAIHSVVPNGPCDSHRESGRLRNF
jgi:hypothetical protein